MIIHLPKDIESSIVAAVHSGLFASVDEAMDQAARLLLRDMEQTKHRQGQLGKAAKRARPAQPKKKPLTRAQFDQQPYRILMICTPTSHRSHFCSAVTAGTLRLRARARQAQSPNDIPCPRVFSWIEAAI